MPPKKPFEFEDVGSSDAAKAKKPFDIRDVNVDDQKKKPFEFQDVQDGRSNNIDITKMSSQTSSTNPIFDDYVPQPQDPGENNGMSYINQMLELISAPRNLVNQQIDSAISGGKPSINDNGKHNAKTFRQNLLRSFGDSQSSIDKAGYAADQSRGWRDDLNTVLFNPFDKNYDKAKSDLGKRAADSAIDLGYEVATDPLSYAGAVLKGVGKGAEALGIVKAASSPTSGALKGAALGGSLGVANQMSHEAGDERPYIGPIEGASLGVVPALTTIGAGVVSAAGDKVVKNILEGKTAQYMGKMMDLSQYPALKPVADEIRRKSDYVAHMIRQGKRKVFEGMTDEEAVQVEQFFSNAKNLSDEISQGAYYEQTKALIGEKSLDGFKDKALAELQKKYAGDQAREITEQMINTKTADLALKAHDPSGNVGRYVWNQSRDVTNKTIRSNPKFIELSTGLSDKGLKSAEDWVTHNINVREMYNKAKGYDEVFDPNINLRTSKPGANDYTTTDGWVGATARPLINDTAETIKSKIESGVDGIGPVYSERKSFNPTYKDGFEDIGNNSGFMVQEGKGDALKNHPMVGLDFHTSDVYDKEAFEASKQLFATQGQDGFKRSLFGGESDAVSRLIKEGVPPREAYDRAYSAYSDQAAKAMLDATEKEAMFIVNKGGQYFKDLPGLGVVDALTSSVKKKWLYLNTSWAKTNYWDNLLKVITETGYINGSKFAVGGPFQKKMANDIEKTLAGTPLHISSDRTNKYIKLGVVDNTYNLEAKGLTETEMGLRFSPDSKLRSVDNSFAGKINRTTDNFLSIPGVKQFAETTAALGQRFEVNARIMTFENLVKNGVPEEQAAKMVQKAFYDYSKVSAFGKEIGKRVIPFYSFVTKNMQYWPEAMTDATKLGRLNNVLTSSRRLGVGPAERDPDIGRSIGAENSYLKNGYPQIAAGENDYTTLYSAPKMSVFDALGMYTDPFKVAHGITPFLRVPAELGTGIDVFSGQPMNPEKNPYGKKNWLGASGYGGLLLNKIEPNFTADFKLSDLIADEEGTISQKMSRAAKGAISAALGQTSVKANKNTGTPETTSSLPMYYNKLNELIPFVPGVGGLGTLYNVLNSPVAKTATKSFENMLNEDNETTKAIDVLSGLIAPFDTIKKDTKKLEDKNKEIIRGKK